MSKYLLAIDQGTTSTRAVIFAFTPDRQLSAVASHQVTLAQHFPDNGWVEHDAEEIWQATLAVCRTALTKAQISWQQVLCMGITNQRETTVLWDKKKPASARQGHCLAGQTNLCAL
jgi:glycerol kinase